MPRPSDRLRRRLSAVRADGQQPTQTEHARLVEHPAQRPGGQPAPARGRPDAVTDVAGPPHVVVATVSQRDPAEHAIALHNPSIRATGFAAVDRRCRIRLVRHPRHPGREPSRRIHLVGRAQPETVLVQPGTPLGMSLKPGSVQADGRCDQLRHAVTVPARAHMDIRLEPGASQATSRDPTVRRPKSECPRRGRSGAPRNGRPEFRGTGPRRTLLDWEYAWRSVCGSSLQSRHDRTAPFLPTLPRPRIPAGGIASGQPMGVHQPPNDLDDLPSVSLRIALL